MSNEWYYSSNGQQLGPVSAQQLKGLAAGGQLTPHDLVWRDGLPEWTPAAKVKGLFPGGAGDVGGTATAVAAAPYGSAHALAQPGAYPAPANADYAGGGAYAGQPAAVGYYSPTSDLNARTQRILGAIPPVSGPRGEWPLSDHHLSQLALTADARRPVRAFGVMCWILTVLYGVMAVVWTILLIDMSSYRYRSGEPMLVMGTMIAVAAVLAVLHPLAAGAAKGCRAWGPITILVVHAISVLLTLFGLVSIGANSYRTPVGVILSGLLAIGLEVLFIVFSARAIGSIGRFLKCPVWCVEAMVNSRL